MYNNNPINRFLNTGNIKQCGTCTKTGAMKMGTNKEGIKAIYTHTNISRNTREHIQNEYKIKLTKNKNVTKLADTK